MAAENSGTNATGAIVLSVVAPLYNEIECVGSFVAEMCRALEGLGRPYELLCVDDGSSDGTYAELLALVQAFPCLRPVALDRNHGQSAALAAGISLARGSLVVLTDADLQNDPGDINRLLARIESDGCDGVVGVRVRRRDSWLRRLSSRVGNWFSWALTRDRVRDAGCGLKIFRAESIKGVAFFRGAHRFLATLVRQDGGQVLEMEVNHRPRPFGASKYGNGLGRTWIALRDALGVRWLADRHLRYRIVDRSRS